MHKFIFGLMIVSAVALAGQATEKMPEWMKFGKPSQGHKALGDFAGKWNYTLKWWMAADGKAEVSKGTSTAKWVMGGRFIQQDVKAKMQGADFVGMGLTGYDNLRNEYQSVWVDNMSTHMMVSAGTSTGDLISETGTMACPMTQDKNRPFRTELKKVNKNEHTFTMYMNGQDGREFKSMEIVYKRVGKENSNAR